MSDTLLVEILTEELPPRSLARLSRAFGEGLLAALAAERLVPADAATQLYATPRRLAVSILGVAASAAARTVEVTGPAVKAGLDANGRPTAALTGFARKNGVAPEDLVRIDTPKGEVFACRRTEAGALLDDVLAARVEDALKRLPVARLMRWGDGEVQFVRPVHGVVMMHGARVVPGSVLGIAASSTTHGHRFLSSGSIRLAGADEYEARLRDDGRVIADFEERRTMIAAQLAAAAAGRNAALGEHADLLDEVTALVEHPSVYAGEFDERFLEVPQECLILTMRQNQKYFPLFDRDGRLLPTFLIVSNMEVADPSHIVNGNQRVVRPRLEDARFFYDQDRRQRLEARVPMLDGVVYHNRLGSQLARVERVQLLAGEIARRIGADAMLAERAAWLAKADLLSAMVGEFPELQGVMGRYYALHDGEAQQVADAIEAHYRPRFAGDTLPQHPVGCAVALADRLDTLVGMFAVGNAPTGDKDPFALRRHALGVLRMLIESGLALELPALLECAAARFDPALVGDWVAREVYAFMLDRLRHHLRELGYAADEVDAVLSQSPARIDLVCARLDAVKSFRHLPEAASLAAANKRIRNILRKSDGGAEHIDAALLSIDAERELHAALGALGPDVQANVARTDYAAALHALAGVRGSVDRFFDDVMVNVDDARVRDNRLALLRELDRLMNQVADISRLAA